MSMKLNPKRGIESFARDSLQMQSILSHTLFGLGRGFREVKAKASQAVHCNLAQYAFRVLLKWE
jgi:hypothetical protein